MNKWLVLVLVLALLGVADSAYLLKLHNQEGPTVCDISATFSCSAVSDSKFSEIAGIPMALLGLLFYIFITFYVLALAKGWFKKSRISAYLIPDYLVIFTAIGFMFQAYLTALEIWVIEAFCLFCLASQLIVFLMLIASYCYYKIKA